MMPQADVESCLQLYFSLFRKQSKHCPRLLYLIETQPEMKLPSYVTGVPIIDEKIKEYVEWEMVSLSLMNFIEYYSKEDSKYSFH